MEFFDPVSLVGGFCRIEIGSASSAEIGDALGRVRRLRACFDAAEVALAARWRELNPLADRDVSVAAQRSARHGARVAERGATVDAVAGLGALFDAGEVSGEHVDVVTRAVKAAPAEMRDGLRAAASLLVGEVAAFGLTPDDLAVRLADETRRLEADDGVARLERQRAATRLRSWTRKSDGMFCLSGQFDPLSGVAIDGRLKAAMAAMFAGGLPDMAPDDPVERTDFLRGLSFLALTAGVKGGAGPESSAASDPNVVWAPFANHGPPRFGRPEVIVVVDYTSLDTEGRPSVDWGGPIRLPFQCVQDLLQHAAVHQVVVNNGNVVDPDGELDLGRTTRLANRGQRRGLRALYKTCAMPGCGVHFDFTEPHHLKRWRDGGDTDISNLLPLSALHHGCAHSGWVFELGPNRELTITFPNGQIMTTGPPKRAVA